MTHPYHTTIQVEYQQYCCNHSEKNENGKRVLEFNSRQIAMDVNCPMCGGRVIGHGIRRVRLTDIPYVPGCATVYEIHQHRYRCKECWGTFCETNPFKARGTNLTKRCVMWIFELMKYKMPTASIAAFFGIHWNTVRKLEKMRVEYILEARDKELFESMYRPYYLAVDEFAIRKGHRYATCVMDLVKGDILWVGKGRTIKDFIGTVPCDGLRVIGSACRHQQNTLPWEFPIAQALQFCIQPVRSCFQRTGDRPEINRRREYDHITVGKSRINLIHIILL